MIIDIHAHLGIDTVFDLEQTEEKLLEIYDSCKVDKAIIQPFSSRPYLSEAKAAHDRVYKFCQHHPGRFFGMVSINPHYLSKDFDIEVARCLIDLGFVGIKISTIGYAVNPSSNDGMHVFEVAKAYGVPVMIHTGLGSPFAAPTSAWQAIKKYPEVNVVLAHAGGNEMQEQAVMLAMQNDNVFLEPSWLPGVSIASMIRRVGASKILFSSDEADNLPIAISMFKLIVRNGTDLANIFYRNAQRLYKL